MNIPEVARKARLHPAGLVAFFFATGDDPDDRKSWAAVSRGEADLAVVRNGEGYVLFRAWRISPISWAWQSSTMGAPAFAAYGD